MERTALHTGLKAAGILFVILTFFTVVSGRQGQEAGRSQHMEVRTNACLKERIPQVLNDVFCMYTDDESVQDSGNEFNTYQKWLAGLMSFIISYHSLRLLAMTRQSALATEDGPAISGSVFVPFYILYHSSRIPSAS